VAPRVGAGLKNRLISLARMLNHRRLHHGLMGIDEFVSGRFPCLLFSVNFDMTTTITMTIISEFRVDTIYSRQSSMCARIL
jgi:hypothetical protein